MRPLLRAFWRSPSTQSPPIVARRRIRVEGEIYTMASGRLRRPPAGKPRLAKSIYWDSSAGRQVGSGLPCQLSAIGLGYKLQKLETNVGSMVATNRSWRTLNIRSNNRRGYRSPLSGNLIQFDPKPVPENVCLLWRKPFYVEMCLKGKTGRHTKCMGSNRIVQEW